MKPLESAPASIREWFAAEDRGDRGDGLRRLLSGDVAMDFGGRKFHGIEDVIGVVAFVMPQGWLGEVERHMLPTSPDGSITIRATRKGGGLLEVMVPGAPSQHMTAMDFLFTLDADGRINGLGGQAHHIEPEGLGTPLHPGDTPPPFVLPDTDGREVALADTAATATVVAFISNHCPFSLTWHDRLQDAARDYASRGVRFLFINANDPEQGPKDGIEHARERVAAGAFAGPYLIDATQEVARGWGARRTPELFVLNPGGVITYHGAPDGDSTDDAQNAAWLRAALDRLLAGEQPDPAETEAVGCTIKWKR